MQPRNLRSFRFPFGPRSIWGAAKIPTGSYLVPTYDSMDFVLFLCFLTFWFALVCMSRRTTWFGQRDTISDNQEGALPVPHRNRGHAARRCATGDTPGYTGIWNPTAVFLFVPSSTLLPRFHQQTAKHGANFCEIALFQGYHKLLVLEAYCHC